MAPYEHLLCAKHSMFNNLTLHNKLQSGYYYEPIFQKGKLRLRGGYKACL